MTLLVIGCKPGSLGDHITSYARERGEEVLTAGISGKEDLTCHLEFPASIAQAIETASPNSIICTAGVNPQGDASGRFAMEVNYFGVMNVLDYWLPRFANGGQFVAISSNSAHIARTQSRGYCTSKAALSMGIRVSARENAARDALIYAWEFGLLEGTPMTEQVARRLGRSTGLTRMPGHPRGQSVAGAARLVVDAYIGADTALNGCTLRLDGGDQ